MTFPSPILPTAPLTNCLVGGGLHLNVQQLDGIALLGVRVIPAAEGPHLAAHVFNALLSVSLDACVHGPNRVRRLGNFTPSQMFRQLVRALGTILPQGRTNRKPNTVVGCQF